MNSKRILALSFLTIFLFSFMLTSVDAAKQIGEDCTRGFWGLIGGKSCVRTAYCDTTQQPSSPDEFDGKCALIMTKENTDNLISDVLITEGAEGNFLIERGLIFLLIFFCIFGLFGSINLFSGKRGISAILWVAISAIISILGVRFISTDIIASMLAPTTALAALITSGIPFLVVFLITNKNVIMPDRKPEETKFMGPTAKRIVWVIFLAFMIYSLVNTNMNGKIEQLEGTTGRTMNVIFIIFGIVAIVFVLFQPMFDRLFLKAGRATLKQVMEGTLTNTENAVIRGNTNAYMIQLDRFNEVLRLGGPKDPGLKDQYDKLHNLNPKMAENYLNGLIRDGQKFNFSAK